MLPDDNKAPASRSGGYGILLLTAIFFFILAVLAWGESRAAAILFMLASGAIIVFAIMGAGSSIEESNRSRPAEEYETIEEELDRKFPVPDYEKLRKIAKAKGKSTEDIDQAEELERTFKKIREEKLRNLRGRWHDRS